jgi:hypothetical protein
VISACGVDCAPDCVSGGAGSTCGGWAFGSLGQRVAGVQVNAARILCQAWVICSAHRQVWSMRSLVRRRSRGAWTRQRGPSRSSRSPATHCWLQSHCRGSSAYRWPSPAGHPVRRWGAAGQLDVASVRPAEWRSFGILSPLVRQLGWRYRLQMNMGEQHDHLRIRPGYGRSRAAVVTTWSGGARWAPHHRLTLNGE